MAVAVAEVDAEILHELVVHHRGRRSAGALQEGLQAGAADVVDAGQPEHVELVEGQAGLDGPQGLDLAAHPDGQQATDATAGQLLEHLQIGREGGLIHPGRNDLGRGAGQHGHGREAVVWALLHAKHRIDQARFQGAHADAADDAGPLGALDRRLQPGAEHALADAEIELVFVVLVASTAVGGRFHRLKALVQKGAGLAHVGHPAAVTEAAVAAEVLGGLGAALGQGPGPLVGGQRGPFGGAGGGGHRRAPAGQNIK